jgi:hypothetical protein
MNCPKENCGKRLHMQGVVFQVDHEIITYGFCQEHGEMKFILEDKKDQNLTN